MYSFLYSNGAQIEKNVRNKNFRVDDFALTLKIRSLTSDYRPWSTLVCRNDRSFSILWTAQLLFQANWVKLDALNVRGQDWIVKSGNVCGRSNRTVWIGKLVGSGHLEFMRRGSISELRTLTQGSKIPDFYKNLGFVYYISQFRSFWLIFTVQFYWNS